MEFLARDILQKFVFLLCLLPPKRTAAFDAIPAVGTVDPKSRINTASPPTRMLTFVTFMTDRLDQDRAQTNNYVRRIKHAAQMMAKKKSLKLAKPAISGQSNKLTVLPQFSGGFVEGSV